MYEFGMAYLLHGGAEQVLPGGEWAELLLMLGVGGAVFAASYRRSKRQSRREGGEDLREDAEREESGRDGPA